MVLPSGYQIFNIFCFKVQLNREVLANSADPDQAAPGEQSNRSLNCLLFRLHFSQAMR